MTKREKVDTYQIVTDRIDAALEAGVIPWAKPWNSRHGAPMSMQTNRAYRGVNVWLLSASAQVFGYSSRWWLTFKQAKERGGSVRKGEHGTPIVFWSKIDKTDKATGQVTDSFYLLRYYTVFNLDQCDGIADPDDSLEPREPVAPLEACEDIWNGFVGAPTVTHGGDRASYNGALDAIRMPERDDFHSSEAYYATLFHEGIHSTAHESRLDREKALGNRFGDELYGREELTAEFGAAMLCAVAGIEPNIEQHAAYIDHWRKAIANDPKLIVNAAGSAQKAADYILGDRDEASEDSAAEKVAA